jgi:hypothetical protein
MTDTAEPIHLETKGGMIRLRIDGSQVWMAGAPFDLTKTQEIIKFADELSRRSAFTGRYEAQRVFRKAIGIGDWAGSLRLEND